MLTSDARQDKARLASLTRHRGADDPEVVKASTQYRTDRLAEYIRDTVDAAPPLTADQRDRLARLLRSGGAS